MSDAGERILIVEDEGSLADSVRYNLEREGFVVTVASDGRRRSNGSAPSRRPS